MSGVNRDLTKPKRDFVELKRAFKPPDFLVYRFWKWSAAQTSR